MPEPTAKTQADPLAASDSPDAWIPRVYEELRRMARQQMRQEAHATLQTTVLVHEVYLRLFAGRELVWENRAHFFGAAARAMRQILIDHARARRAIRRGRGARHEPIHEIDIAAPTTDPDRVLGLHEALEKLERRDPRKAQIVMLRYFAGLTILQSADVLELSPTTVKAEWQFARAWLFHEMSSGGDDARPTLE
ncbi:MAG: sigma-70 family RNA polymerase sigma factor [Phycisphaerales bacterium]|nr:sigma-70 family RNA polymerase sigma factor [Phycisphaerales bacterium]